MSTIRHKRLDGDLLLHEAKLLDQDETGVHPGALEYALPTSMELRGACCVKDNAKTKKLLTDHTALTAV